MSLSVRALVTGMVAFGALNTLVRKAQLVTCSYSSFPVNAELAEQCTDPNSEPFNKPWIGNLFMFLGEMLLLLIVRQERAQRAILEGMTNTASPQGGVPAKFFLLPALLDVTGSGLSGIGMLYLSASVWQMMRGSLVIYTAILSVAFLNRRLGITHIVGLLLAAAGLALVGVSCYLDEQGKSFSSGKSSLVLIGISLTIWAQLCTAIQVVLEEYMMKEYSSPPSPARVVALEGVWGTLVMVVLLTCFQLLPGDDHNSIENSLDSGEKIANSSFLVILIIGYVVSIAVFNVLGMTVSKRLSAVHRTLIDSTRAALVWIVQLCLGSSPYGTEWSQHSWLQAVGFLTLVVGTLIYNEILFNPENEPTELEPILLESS